MRAIDRAVKEPVRYKVELIMSARRFCQCERELGGARYVGVADPPAGNEGVSGIRTSWDALNPEFGG